GQNELVAVATDEIPPQAQVFAGPGGIALAPGTTSLHVSIQPVPPPAQPASGYIDGNVYAFSITDQAGTQLSAVAAAKVTIVMRSAQASLTDGVIERYDGTSWQELGPPGSGLGGFLAVVTAFGDFAVVGLGPSPYATPAATPGAPAGSPGLTITPSISPNPSAGTVESPTASAVPGPPSGGEVPSWLFLVGAAAALTALAASVLWRPARRRSAASRRPPGRGSGSGRPARRRDR
ncbi:MAG TPA: hypothetical protein VET90_06460, partial [Candidatus Binatus sp.]|nr:hypothetical protein [Candidatus Binatus sp.]